MIWDWHDKMVCIFVSIMRVPNANIFFEWISGQQSGQVPSLLRLEGGVDDRSF